MKMLQITLAFLIAHFAIEIRGAEPSRQVYVINHTGKSMSIAYTTSDRVPLSSRIDIDDNKGVYVSIGNAYEIYVVGYTDGKEHHWGWTVPKDSPSETSPTITLARVWETRTREIEYWDSCTGAHRVRTVAYSVSHVVGEADKLQQIDLPSNVPWLQWSSVPSTTGSRPFRLLRHRH